MKFTVWNVSGALVSFFLGGPIALIVFLIVWLITWYYLSTRGLLFIQSYAYLLMMAEKNDPHEASIESNNMKAYEAESFLAGAKGFANKFTNGEQLPVIEAAKKQGYIYRKKSFLELIREVWGSV